MSPTRTHIKTEKQLQNHIEKYILAVLFSNVVNPVQKILFRNSLFLALQRVNRTQMTEKNNQPFPYKI